MYVGRCSLWISSHYLTGYCHAADDANSPCKFKDDSNDGLNGGSAFFNSGWHWVRILQHEYGSDESAIARLPELYSEFRRQTDCMTEMNCGVWWRLSLSRCEATILVSRRCRHVDKTKLHILVTSKDYDEQSIASKRYTIAAMQTVQSDEQ